MSAVRKREILEATKVKVSGSEKYSSETEFIPHFLNKTCINQEVNCRRLLYLKH